MIEGRSLESRIKDPYVVSSIGNDHFRDCAILCKEVRGMKDYEDATSPHTFATLVDLGGFVTGAFRDEKLVGYIFVFPPLIDYATDTKYLFVDDMVVDSTLQGSGFATHMFIEALNEARKRYPDIKVAKWTYDPLRANLAHLYLNKFTGVINEYHESNYPPEKSGLNAGLPSDRAVLTLWLEEKPDIFSWDVNSNEIEYAPYINDGDVIDGNCLWFKFRIPLSIDLIKKDDMRLAFDLRIKSRIVFQNMLKNGYSVVGSKKTDSGLEYIFKKIKTE